jgi:hypothetical protein
VTSSNALPGDVTMKTRVCKMWGLFCTPTVGYAETNFCDEWNLYDPHSQYNNCPAAGTYNFRRSTTIPSNALSDWAYKGLGFDIQVEFQADDQGNDHTHMWCKAHFTTIDYDAYDGAKKNEVNSNSSSDLSYLSYSVVALVGLGAYAGFQARRRRLALSPALNLDDPTTDTTCNTDFEMMGYHGGGGAGPDADSVRV